MSYYIKHRITKDALPHTLTKADPLFGSPSRWCCLRKVKHKRMKAEARHSNFNILSKTLSYNHQKYAIGKSTDNRHVFGAMKRIMNEDTIASISGNEFFDGNLEATDKLCQHVILNGTKYIGGQLN